MRKRIVVWILAALSLAFVLSFFYDRATPPPIVEVLEILPVTVGDTREEALEKLKSEGPRVYPSSDGGETIIADGVLTQFQEGHCVSAASSQIKVVFPRQITVVSNGISVNRVEELFGKPAGTERTDRGFAHIYEFEEQGVRLEVRFFRPDNIGFIEVLFGTGYIVQFYQLSRRPREV